MNTFAHRRSRGFSLVEVVLALGIVSFALVALLGLGSVGMNLQKNSNRLSRATEMAGSAISVRRLSPTNAIANWPIGPVTNYPAAAATNSGYLGKDGRVTSSATDAVFRYQLGGRYDPDARCAFFDLLLWWPAERATPVGAEQFRAVTMISSP